MAHIEGAVGELVDELKARKGESAGSVPRVVRSSTIPMAWREATRRVADAVTLPGQHQLLSWHVDIRIMEFLRNTRAELDVDEYG